MGAERVVMPVQKKNFFEKGDMDFESYVVCKTQKRRPTVAEMPVMTRPAGRCKSLCYHIHCDGLQ